MVKFRPKEKSVYQRLFASTAFQVSVLVVAVVLVFSFVRYQRKTDLSNRIAEIENARSRSVVEKGLSSADAASQSTETVAANRVAEDARAPESADAQEVAANGAQAVAAPAFAPPPPNASGLGAAATAAAKTAEDAGGGSASGATTPASKTIRFLAAEVPAALLNDFMMEAPKSFRAEGMTYFTVKDLEAKLARARMLDQSDQQNLVKGKPNAGYLGETESNTQRFVGFSLRATPVTLDENGVQLQVSIARSLVLTQTPPYETVSLQVPDEPLVIPHGSSLVAVGSLRGMGLSAADEQAYKQSRVLRVLSSEAFKSSQTEFVLIIDLK